MVTKVGWVLRACCSREDAVSKLMQGVRARLYETSRLLVSPSASRFATGEVDDRGGDFTGIGERELAGDDRGGCLSRIDEPQFAGTQFAIADGQVIEECRNVGMVRAALLFFSCQRPVEGLLRIAIATQPL